MADSNSSVSESPARIVSRARHLVASLAEDGLKLQDLIDAIDALNAESDTPYLRRFRDAAIAAREIVETGALDTPMPLHMPGGRHFTCGDTLALLKAHGEAEMNQFKAVYEPARHAIVNADTQFVGANMAVTEPPSMAMLLYRAGAILQTGVGATLEELAADTTVAVSAIPRAGRG